MNKLIVGLIAAAFASTAFAQTVGETPKDKAKQAEVQSVTKQNAEGAASGAQAQGMEANKAKATATPKVKTTAQQKQQAVSATTKANAQGADINAQTAGSTAIKDKGEKNTPKALPTKEDKQKAAAATTEKAIKKDGSN